VESGKWWKSDRVTLSSILFLQVHPITAHNLYVIKSNDCENICPEEQHSIAMDYENERATSSEAFARNKEEIAWIAL